MGIKMEREGKGELGVLDKRDESGSSDTSTDGEKGRN